MKNQHAVVVTGASSGIGLALCTDLLAQGKWVIGLSLEACPLTHERFVHEQIDLSDVSQVQITAQRLAATYQINALVHNAGAIRAALLEQVEQNDFEILMRLHWGAAVQIAQACLPAMKASGSGRIVFVSSRAALGLATRSAYSATKAGMIGLARTWALELASSGITVNVVAPGPIRGTRVFHEVVAAGSEREQQLAKNIPVQRLGEPEDVSRAIQFFLDPRNSFVTGQTLYVCGGASVGSLSI